MTRKLDLITGRWIPLSGAPFSGTSFGLSVFHESFVAHQAWISLMKSSSRLVFPKI